MEKQKFIRKVVMPCECDCSGIQISKYIWKDGASPGYDISTYINSFYANYKGIFSELTKRIKLASKILFKGVHDFDSIYITEEKFKLFCKEINDLLVEFPTMFLSKIQKDGWVVIPQEALDKLDLKENDKVTVGIVNGEIILEKVNWISQESQE